MCESKKGPYRHRYHIRYQQTLWYQILLILLKFVHHQIKNLPHSLFGNERQSEKAIHDSRLYLLDILVDVLDDVRSVFLSIAKLQCGLQCDRVEIAYCV